LIVEIINCVFGVKIKLLPQLLRPKMQKIEKSTVFITSSKKSSFYIETFLYISRRINIIDFTMKKIFILACILLGIGGNYFSQTTYTWTGATDSDFFTNSNWNPSTGFPGAGDNALFNSGSVSCNIAGAIGLGSFSLMSGYTGIIDMGASDHILSGNLIVNSGTLISTTGFLELDLTSGSSSFSLGGGVFTNNGGSIDIWLNAGTTFNFSGNIVLNVLNIFPLTGNLTSRTIDFGANLTATDMILNATAARVHDFHGTIHIKNSLDLGNSSHTANNTNNNGTFIFDGSSASIIGSTSTGAGKAYLPNIEINTSGNYSFTRSLNVRGNWAGSQGTLTAGTTTVNMYGTSAAISGTAAAFDNLIIRSSASVSFPASAEVLVARTFSNGGSVTFPSTTTLGLNGTTAQNIIGNGFTIGGIHTYSNSGGRTITFSAPVTILDFLDVDGTSMTIATGTNLTLNSSVALTARLGPVGIASSITGSVTVETMVPGGTTGWALLGPRGVDGQTIASWDTYVSSGGTTGLPMTCTLCANHPSVIGTGTAAFVSVQGWNEPGGSYTELIATDPLTPGVGIWAYVGDGFQNTNPLKLINTGTLKTGLVSIPLTAAGPQLGFNLVANPYPSPISWNLVMSNVNNIFNVNDAIYAFDANSGAYTQFVAGFGTPGAPSGIDDVIAGGQGFYIEAPGGGSIEFEESHKVTSNTSSNPLIRGASTASIGQTFRLKIVGINDHDEAGFRIHGNATADFDKKYDAKKIFQSPGYVGYPGAYSKYTTISSKDDNGFDYSIQSLPPLTNALNIPLLARVSTTGSYTISAFDFQDFAMCVGLIDKLDNSYHDLRLSPYVFTISDTTSTPRFELVLCKDESLNAVGISEATESNSIFITQDALGAYVKTVFEKNTKATISVFNIIGQKLMKDVTVEGMVTNTALPIELHNQVVIIKVTTDKETVTKKIVLH
jgi:hypothetical protein